MEIKLNCVGNRSVGGVDIDFIGKMEIPSILLKGTTGYYKNETKTITFNINGVSTPVTSNDEGIFEITEGDKELTTCKLFASGQTWLKTIEEFNYDTSKVTDMESMFGGCSSLISIPLLDTSNVTNMTRMFSSCERFTTIPELNTSKVTIMSHMFNYCRNITTIPLLNTSNVTNMDNMFRMCSNLTSIPELDTSKVTDMNNMFYYCSRLTSIPKLNTSNVTNMANMFGNCSKLTSIPELNTSNVIKMSYMFNSCSGLASIPLLDTSKVTDMGSMFSYCSNLTTLGGFKGLKTDLNLSSSTKITHESLMNVINYTDDVTSDPKTLTLGSTNLAKLTDDEKAIATNKGWTLK